MDRKSSRLCFLVAACSLTGVILGGTASRAEINQCLISDNPANHCLVEDPITKTIEGMSMGLVAGAGAAVGAVWQVRHQDS
jgi:hypothetical protein